MSSFRKALKSQQKKSQERSQPGFRKHLGHLEKKKDYKLRADDYHKKPNTLNPDEFYFKMVSSQLKVSHHVGLEQRRRIKRKLMRTQDIRYVEMKSKIEGLLSELHLLDADGKQKNGHAFYVGAKQKVADFDLASHLDTAPELVERVYNWPTLHTVTSKTIQGAVEPLSIKVSQDYRKHQYNILSQRIDREKKFVIGQKIQTRKDLHDKNEKVKVSKETVNASAVYKFEAKRKR
uniref:U3 small nucleolar RNA-associated protein 11 n=1 Tax=Oncorhynchus mykiss TaxID=8022 RepID=A0A8C7VFF9_ONCMY